MNIGRNSLIKRAGTRVSATFSPSSATSVGSTYKARIIGKLQRIVRTLGAKEWLI